MGNLTIKVLMDNRANRNDMAVEHGLSVWMEYKGRKLLFDLGQSEKVFENAQKLDIDPFSADAVVISHGHFDHAGGLDRLLDNGYEGELYLHPSAGKIRYSQTDCGVKGVGISRDCFELVKYYDKKKQVVWTTMPVVVSRDITVTGQIPQVTDFEKTMGKFFFDMNCLDDDKIKDELAMVIETEKGLVVFFGCAHRGVVNTLSYIEHLFSDKRIYGIFGGLHLENASSERLEKTIQAIKDRNVQLIGVNHCTGQLATEMLKDKTPDRVIDFSCGTEIEI